LDAVFATSAHRAESPYSTGATVMGQSNVLCHLDERSLAERLERGEVIHYPACPFAVAQGDDLAFLLEQRLASRAHKNIGYDPQSGKLSGYLHHAADQGERLKRLLADFARAATTWLADRLPRYAQGWQKDRVSYRPEEEATRKLRLTARNDLL